MPYPVDVVHSQINDNWNSFLQAQVTIHFTLPTLTLLRRPKSITLPPTFPLNQITTTPPSQPSHPTRNASSQQLPQHPQPFQIRYLANFHHNGTAIPNPPASNQCSLLPQLPHLPLPAAFLPKPRLHNAYILCFRVVSQPLPRCFLSL